MLQAVLNSVTVPMGAQLGTDSSADEDQRPRDMRAVYDAARVLYWRTQTSMNLARLALADARLAEAARRHAGVRQGRAAWFVDAVAR